MKKKPLKNTVNYHVQDLPADKKTDWKRLSKMTDAELEKNAKSDKDSIFADDKFWHSAHLVMPQTLGKERITIRLDADILDWLKGHGRGYQSRINMLLRHCMNLLNNGQKIRHKRN